MSSPSSIRRLVVCVDGPKDWAAGNTNVRNIARIHSVVGEGTYKDSRGRTITQITTYHEAVDTDASLLNKFKNSREKPSEQIETITQQICQSLDGPQDELFLYGFGQGANIVRAVATVLHHMGLPKKSALYKFRELYQHAVELVKAKREDDGIKGLKIMQILKGNCDGPPQIQFIGLFDMIKGASDKTIHDASLLDSIRNIRHAVALNENRSNLTPDLVALPNTTDLTRTSLVLAWFIGTHEDIGGGVNHDGLSLYPLQWMLLESIKAGLLVKQPRTSGVENPLSLAFPQFAGEAPQLGANERIEWRMQFVNGLEVSMFDLHSSHAKAKGRDDSTHSLRLHEENSFYNSPRKVFEYNGLTGWSSTSANGTIIHPSVYCILDRFSRLQESPRFKSLRQDLASFQDQCVQGTDGLPPWLEDSELQATGVKAFRILVCGKTGVGKSTLINKVFGVEMTEESKTYQQGVHDINEAFEAPSQPGLLIHDSRGWQAGSEQELDLIAKFLRHRAFQKNPADALHVIWFCVDADVSRIEEADRRTFETIAKFSHNVPVFVVGTKKDKLVALRKIQLLETYMEQLNDYAEASRLANIEADKLANEQFGELRSQLSRIEHYKADGFCCLSKDDESGVKNLLSQTLELITDDRVRLFCVAAQVVDVSQKINSAITESMRLSIHAIRTAAAPIPFSGIIGTPTVSKILCANILQCFGFPKAAPEEIEAIMSNVVMKNLKKFMVVTLAEFAVIGGIAIGVGVVTAGIGAVLGLSSCILSAPPTARMLFKCACDMILILERSFRYGGKYVSVKQIEDGAKYYTTTTVRTFAGKTKMLQQSVHDEVDRVIPLKSFRVAFKYTKLRTDLENIIYHNRFDKSPAEGGDRTQLAELAERSQERSELSEQAQRLELDGQQVELDGKSPLQVSSISELEGDLISPVSPSMTMMSPISTLTTIKSPMFQTDASEVGSSSWTTSSETGELKELTSNTSTIESASELYGTQSFRENDVRRGQSEPKPKFMTRFSSSFKLKKSKSKP